MLDLLIKIHVTGLIFASAATPAMIISSQFLHFCSILISAQIFPRTSHGCLRRITVSASARQFYGIPCRAKRQCFPDFTPFWSSTSCSPRPRWKVPHKTPVHGTPSEYFLCIPVKPFSVLPWHPHPDGLSARRARADCSVC